MILPMRRGRIVAAVVALVLALYLASSWPRDDAKPSYVTEAIDRGPITATVTATGTVNPVVSVDVGTYVSGPIQALYADYNTPVKKGQLLARIDPRPFQVKVDGATADLANAKARLDKDRADAALKRITLARTRALGGKGIVSASDLDLAESQARQAEAQIQLDEAEIQAAEARLRESQVNLAYTEIASPVDGVVVSRNVSVGQTVAASFQTPTLFLVAGDLAKMQVGASVSESDIGTIAEGQEATFTVDSYPSTTFAARVDQVRNAPVTVQNVVTYDVVLTVDNANLRLKPGMTANVTIVTAHRADTLRVRTSALRFRPEPEAGGSGTAVASAERTPHGTRLWVVGEDGAPRAVPVSVGIAGDRFTEITGGIAEGERAIIALRREPTESAAPRTPSFMPSGRRGR
jgi:HlyD family secretion protein